MKAFPWCWLLWLLLATSARGQWEIGFINNCGSSVSVQVGPTSGTVPNGTTAVLGGWYPGSGLAVSWSGCASGSATLNYETGGGSFVSATPSSGGAGYGGAYSNPASRWMLTLSGSTAATLFRWSHSLTNSSVLAERYRLSLVYTNGVSTNYVETVAPGASVIWEVETTNSFTVSLDRLAPGNGIDLTQLWQQETGLPAPTGTSTNLTESWTAGATTSAGSANVWTGPNAASLGNLPAAISATSGGTRGTNFVDSATATATSDANQNQRFAELQSVLVAGDTRAAERTAIQSAQLAAGLDRVRDAVLSVGSHLGGALTNGTGTAFTAGSNMVSGSVRTLLGTSNTLKGLLPSWSAPSAVAPVFALPLAALHPDLEDVEVNFGVGDLGEWAGMFRSFALLLVTVGFFFASLRLVGRWAGV